ncbi:MAG: HTTM domain-containing protein [Proteobacteria bacterium]|nr:HTTM domain-containing protein [Pseudomonadota bacterium]
MIRRWVAFWNTEESATTLAAVRVLMPLVLLSDLLHVWFLGLHDVMWSPEELGGWSVTAIGAEQPLFGQIFGGTTETSVGLFWLVAWLCVMVSTGTFTRTSALMLALCYAQLEDFLPVADRAIDRLYRNLFLVLAFSGAGKTLSVDAWLRTRAFRDDAVRIGGWARRLFILQVVWMYFDAGLEKGASTWSVMGRYDALHYILQDPIMSRADFTNPGALFHWITRLGTAGTIWWELAAPLMLVALFATGTGRLGRMGRWLRKVRFREVYLAIGMLFHIILWATLELGMFPPAMLVLYPCFFLIGEERSRD